MIFGHELNFSSPITSLAYILLCSAISSSKVGVKSSSNISDGDSGMATFGPTGELNGCTLTDVSIEDQEGGGGV